MLNDWVAGADIRGDCNRLLGDSVFPVSLILLYHRERTDRELSMFFVMSLLNYRRADGGDNDFCFMSQVNKVFLREDRASHIYIQCILDCSEMVLSGNERELEDKIDDTKSAFSNRGFLT
ncbi:MAG: hypothetical protein ABGY08_02375 [Gammaproteobacteria bacterium]